MSKRHSLCAPKSPREMLRAGDGAVVGRYGRRKSHQAEVNLSHTPVWHCGTKVLIKDPQAFGVHAVSVSRRLEASKAVTFRR
jgi:hypothetical protein